MALGETIRRAIELNPDARHARYDLEAADADITTAGLRPNPQININADLFSMRAPILTPEQKQYGLSLSLPLELGDKRAARLTNAETRKSVTAGQVLLTERSVALAASDGWHEVVRARRALDLVRRARETFDSLVAVNRVRLRNQVITPAELTRSEIAADQYAVQEHEAAFDLEKARRQLGTVIGTMEPVDAADNLDTAAVAVGEDSLVALALERRPEIAAAGSAVELSRTNERLQHALAVPDVSVSLDYTRQQGIPFYGVSASVPLQFFSRNQGEIQKAAVLRQQAESGLEATRARTAAEVRLAYRECASRHEALERLAGVLDRSEQVRRTVEYAYRSGNTTILDFLDAQRTWFETERAWEEALVGYHASRATLAILTGTLPE